MNKKSNKRQKRSLKITENAYSESPSLINKIRFRLSLSNVRLQLTLKDDRMTDSMQKELSKTILGKGCHLPKSEHEVESKYFRYVWILKIRNGKIFKERLTKYKDKHSDIDIYSFSINTPLQIIHFIAYVATIIGIIGSLEWILKIFPR